MQNTGPVQMGGQWVCSQQRPWVRFHHEQYWAVCVTVGRYCQAGMEGEGHQHEATQVKSPSKSLVGTVDWRQPSAKVMLVPQQCMEPWLNRCPEPNINIGCESLTLAVHIRPLWTSWASSHGRWLKALGFLWKSEPEEEIVAQIGDPAIFCLEGFYGIIDR